METNPMNPDGKATVSMPDPDGPKLDPTPELTAERKLEWREACDGGSWWWITDDPDTDVMLSEDEHATVAATFKEAAEYAQFWWDVGPAKDRCTWRALEDLKVGLRALAKAEERTEC